MRICLFSQVTAEYLFNGNDDRFSTDFSLWYFYLTFSANLVSDPCSLEACDHIFCR